MKTQLDILNKLANGELTIKQADIELESLYSNEIVEFGRQSFYSGREIEKYDERGRAIFKRPTYNGYLRELDTL